MLFNSVEFLLFFPLVTLGYFVLPGRYRWAWLLAASVVFYAFFRVVYLAILAATIVIDYAAGRLIEQAHGRRRKAYLVMSLVANIGVLAIFKYYNFLNDNISGLYSLLHLGAYPLPALKILLPIGLSFHTFQAMSYTIEVYRGHQPAERHFGLYALYVMFYPQLAAGPIERPQHLLPQLHAHHSFSYERLRSGLLLLAWGLFKKVVIADRVAVVVNQVYDHYPQYTGFPLLFATACFTLQVYCDFSGYSDIALGAAEVMGFRLMKNFDRPYFAQSLRELWQRWHISLSTWFRDYVYQPLGGNRQGSARHALNLLATFTLSGLWHGAAWNVVAWGALHGLLLIGGTWTRPLRQRLAGAAGLTRVPRLHAALNVACTLTLFGGALAVFRCATLAQAHHVLGHMFTGLGTQLSHPTQWLALASELGLPKAQLAIAALAVSVLFLAEWLQGGGALRLRLLNRPAWVRWPAYYALVLSILLGAYASADPDFFYFRF